MNTMHSTSRTTSRASIWTASLSVCSCFLVLVLTSLFLWNLEYGSVGKGLNSNDKIDRMSCEK